MEEAAERERKGGWTEAGTQAPTWNKRIEEIEEIVEGIKPSGSSGNTKQ